MRDHVVEGMASLARGGTKDVVRAMQMCFRIMELIKLVRFPLSLSLSLSLVLLFRYLILLILPSLTF